MNAAENVYNTFRAFSKVKPENKNQWLIDNPDLAEIVYKVWEHQEANP